MSNVHRLVDDLESGHGGNYQGYYTNAGSGSLSNTQGPPRCIDMFLPGFRWKSGIVIISAIQIVVYMLSVGLGSRELVPSNSTLMKLGSAYAPYFRDGQIWRAITPIFLHASIWHILMNVFFQLRIGLDVERAIGIQRTLALYFLCGIGASLFSMGFAQCQTSVGASGAGFGLIGLQLADLALGWHRVANKDEAIFNVVLFALISIMLSMTPGSAVDWRGHLGGLIIGLSLAMPLNRDRLDPPTWFNKSTVVAGLAVPVLLVAISLCMIFIPALRTEC